MYVRHEIERKSHFCLYNVALRHKGEHKSLVSKKFFNSQVGTNVVRISIHLWFLRFLFDSSFFRNIFVLFSIFFNYYFLSFGFVLHFDFVLLILFFVLIVWHLNVVAKVFWRIDGFEKTRPNGGRESRSSFHRKSRNPIDYNLYIRFKLLAEIEVTN